MRFYNNYKNSFKRYFIIFIVLLTYNNNIFAQNNPYMKLIESAKNLDSRSADKIYFQALTQAQNNVQYNLNYVANLNYLRDFFLKKMEIDYLEPVLEILIPIKQKLFGKDNIEVASDMVDLAKTYCLHLKFDKAESLYNQAIVIDIKSSGPKSSYVARDFRNIGWMYNLRNQYDKAFIFYKQAYDLDRNILDLNSLDLADDIDNLSKLYEHFEHFDIATKLVKQLLSIYQNKYGLYHPLVLDTLDRLSGLYAFQGQYVKAYELANNRYQILKLINSPFFLPPPSITNLASLDFIVGKYDDAEKLYKEALEIDPKFNDINASTTSLHLCLLADFYINLGKYNKALNVLQRKLEFEKNRLHCLRPDDAEKLGLVYYALAKYDEAAKYYNRALLFYQRFYCLYNYSELSDLNMLAQSYIKQGKSAQAEEIFEQTLEKVEQCFGLDTLEVAQILKDYAKILRQLNKESQAKVLEARVSKILTIK